MQLPGIVATELGAGEDVAAEVPLGGDDRLLVTSERTLVYRAGGVLSDESVESFAHDADRLTVSEGRRKATVTFEYPDHSNRELAVPLDRLEDALQPVMAAVLRESGATDPGERVHRVFSFSELTLVVTDERLLKHVGTVLWDADHESIPYESVTDLDYEEGSVATGVVITVDGRVERLKTPNDRLSEVREHLESALLAAHDVASLDDLADEDDAPEEDETELTDTTAVADIGGVDALDTGSETASAADVQDQTGDLEDGDSPDGAESDPDADSDSDARAEADADSDTTTDTGSDEDAAEGGSPDSDPSGADEAAGDEAGADGSDQGESDDDRDDAGAASDGDTPFTESFEPARDAAVDEELSELRAAVERQNKLLKRHNEAIERLVETLRGN